MNSAKLILVDGSSYLYRAFHAMPSLTNSKGQPTGAIYGVVNMVRRLLKDYQPEHVAIVFDAKGKTFRDDLFPDYKAHRPPMPPELSAQIAPLHAILHSMGLPLLMIEGVEADDVIGTLAVQATRDGMRTVISTGDKDLAQLVNPSVELVNTMTETVLDEAGVLEKFGVPPNRIVDFLTLVGDTVDNVPGVAKVGPKTAAKWLADYGSLDELVARVDEVGGKIGENLRAALPLLGLSRQLVTVKCDVSLPVGPTELRPTAPDRDTLIALYRDCEFKTWLNELLGGGAERAAAAPASSLPVSAAMERPPAQYEMVLTEPQFTAWLHKLETATVFAFDTETTSLDYISARLVGLSFSVETGVAAYVPLGHSYLGVPSQLPIDWVLAQLKPLLEDPNRAKVGQNLKYDMNVLANYGIELRGIRYDTMLESYVLDSVATRHNMDALALKYLGYKTLSYEDVTGKGAGQKNFADVDVETATRYAAEDADITFALHQKLYPMVSQHAGLKRVLEEIEIPLVPVLSRIERRGVLIDANLLHIQSRELAKRLLEIEQQAYEVAGEGFNLASPKQIQEILFDRLKLPVTKKTPKGQPSTSEEVLQELADEYLLPRLILEHRGLSKLKSTYTDTLPTQVNPRTGRVHTSYQQAVAATGRLSSTDPNLQNIPVRSVEGRRIRQAFIAPPGHRMVSADYSQIELRIMAHLSADERLLQAFGAGEDVHRATAAEVLGVPLAEVTGEQRRRAKAINFGLIYGMSAFGLARQLDIARDEAQMYMDHYFQRYPGVKNYMESIRQQAREQGFVETIFGRRLHLPEINAANGQRRQAAERTAINAPMQGSAADIIKLAMIRVDDWVSQSKLSARIIMQVHDELVFEVAEDQLDVVKAGIRECMEGAAVLAVPLLVDVGVGGNWDEAH